MAFDRAYEIGQTVRARNYEYPCDWIYGEVNFVTENNVWIIWEGMEEKRGYSNQHSEFIEIVDKKPLTATGIPF